MWAERQWRSSHGQNSMGFLLSYAAVLTNGCAEAGSLVTHTRHETAGRTAREVAALRTVSTRKVLRPARSQDVPAALRPNDDE